jgi:hypothetical protein
MARVADACSGGGESLVSSLLLAIEHHCSAYGENHSHDHGRDESFHRILLLRPLEAAG